MNQTLLTSETAAEVREKFLLKYKKWMFGRIKWGKV
jgi:hypothetical protein